MYQRKAEHETALSKLDDAHSEMLRTINEITEHLNHVAEEQRRLNIERSKRTDDLLYLALPIESKRLIETNEARLPFS